MSNANFRKSKSPEINSVIKTALASGNWSHESGKNHGKIKHLATGSVVTYAISPSDPKGVIQLGRKIKHAELGMPLWGKTKTFDKEIILNPKSRKGTN